MSVKGGRCFFQFIEHVSSHTLPTGFRFFLSLCAIYCTHSVCDAPCFVSKTLLTVLDFWHILLKTIHCFSPCYCSPCQMPCSPLARRWRRRKAACTAHILKMSSLGSKHQRFRSMMMMNSGTDDLQFAKAGWHEFAFRGVDVLILLCWLHGRALRVEWQGAHCSWLISIYPLVCLLYANFCFVSGVPSAQQSASYTPISVMFKCT